MKLSFSFTRAMALVTIIVLVIASAQGQKTAFASTKIIARGIATEDSPDVPIPCSGDTTQTENSVFVHPLDKNIILNSNNSRVSSVSFRATSAFHSTDDGQTWEGTIRQVTESRADPAAAIGRDERYYTAYLTLGTLRGVGVAYSTNGGQDWTHVQVANPGSNEKLDKDHLWIDNNATSPYEGNLYCAWTTLNTGGSKSTWIPAEVYLSRSLDNGLSWSSPIEISSAVEAAYWSFAVNIQTGPNGEVYAVWSIDDSPNGQGPGDENAIGLAKSTDGGETFAPATRIIEDIRGITETGTHKNMRVNSNPCMAVDISGGRFNGNIYVVWSNVGVPGTNIGPDIDVYMIKSTDGGSTWCTPIKVNQDSSGLGKEHFFPWITCDPETGILSVVFYDDRNVDSTDCETFVACSRDAGETWADFKVSDTSFTPSPISEAYFGDYIGIAARGGRVYPAWTDNRTGKAMTYFSPFEIDRILRVPEDYDNIQAAIDVAVDGDTVLVAPGIYYENIDFCGLAITVASRFILDHDPAAIESTIIDGSQPYHSDSASVVRFVSGENSNACIKGFTLRNGTGTKLSGKITSAHLGGGIVCDSSSPTIVNNIIQGNRADYGGGIFASGPDSQVIVAGNLIVHNTALYEGGGIAVEAGIITNNTIANDSAGLSGGGIYVGGTACHIVNNTIVNSEHGGGIYCSTNPDTISYNDIWNNTGGDFAGCDDWGDTTWGTNRYGIPCDSFYNIIRDPDFGDGYDLSSSSACVDAGDNNAPALPATDLNGNTRICGAYVDMGAYEYTFTYVPGDANGDEVVDAADFLYLIAYLYQGGPPPPNMNAGDPNRDCVINGADVYYLRNYLYSGGPAPRPGCVE